MASGSELRALLSDLEWCDLATGATKPHAYKTTFRACPVCHGVQPMNDGIFGRNTDPEAYFPAEWIDHRAGCLMKKVIDEQEKAESDSRDP